MFLHEFSSGPSGFVWQVYVKPKRKNGSERKHEFLRPHPIRAASGRSFREGLQYLRHDETEEGPGRVMDVLLEIVWNNVLSVSLRVTFAMSWT